MWLFAPDVIPHIQHWSFICHLILVYAVHRTSPLYDRLNQHYFKHWYPVCVSYCSFCFPYLKSRFLAFDTTHNKYFMARGACLKNC